MSFNDIRLRDISFNQAKNNIDILGAVRVEKPRGMGGSHYIAVFEGARSWPIDKNTDPLPDDYLKELIDVTGYWTGASTSMPSKR